MGFGFCIPDNPYDRVAVRLGNVRPETHRILRESIPSHWQSETWDDEESVFYIGLKSQDALDQLNRHGVQRLICLRGIPKSCFSIVRILCWPMKYRMRSKFRWLRSRSYFIRWSRLSTELLAGMESFPNYRQRSGRRQP